MDAGSISVRAFRARRAAAFVGMLAAGLALSASAFAGAVPAKVRFGGDVSATRVVLDVPQQVDARIISSDAAKMVIEFPRLSVDPGSGAGQGLIDTWTMDRVGGNARLTLNLSQPVALDKRFSLAPGGGIDFYRYVIDVKPAGGSVAAPKATAAASRQAAPQASLQSGPLAAALKAVTPPPTVAVTIPASEPRAAPSSRLSTRKVIVIDAGHGGHDTGALGAHVQEKAVNLAAAKALKKRLEQSGRYRVVLTRSDDTFIPLEERVRISRDAHADLFISLHSDSGPEGTRGASVYTLSDHGSDRVAAKAENNSNWAIAAGQNGVKAVRQILFDLTQRATRNKSAAFAEILVPEVGAGRPMLTRAHRDAGYVVLFAPDVPAVLLEMGFVTNPADEAILTNPAKRDALAGSIAASIDKYFDTQFVTAAL